MMIHTPKNFVCALFSTFWRIGLMIKWSNSFFQVRKFCLTRYLQLCWKVMIVFASFKDYVIFTNIMSGHKVELTNLKYHEHFLKKKYHVHLLIPRYDVVWSKIKLLCYISLFFITFSLSSHMWVLVRYFLNNITCPIGMKIY